MCDGKGISGWICRTRASGTEVTTCRLFAVLEVEQRGARSGKVSDIGHFGSYHSVKRGGYRRIAQHGCCFAVRSFRHPVDFLEGFDVFGGGRVFLEQFLFPFQVSSGLLQLGLGLDDPGRYLAGS